MEIAPDFYRAHGPMGAAGKWATELRSLPDDIGALCRIVQGVLVHRDLASLLYALTLSAESRDLANTRPVRDALSTITALQERPLSVPRAPQMRMPCVCWHFSTVLATVLREKGIPARARCGFGAYFMPGRYEDHWVAEYWSAAAERWVLVDAQLDSIQKKTFRPDFEPLDVPRNRFILAGDAWQMCRSGRADENLFGLSFLKEQGLWWIGANLIRDLAALNRVEMLPWDVWGIMHEPGEAFGPGELSLLDRVAALTLAGNSRLAELQTIYADPRLEVPDVVFNADRKKRENIAFANAR